MKRNYFRKYPRTSVNFSVEWISEGRKSRTRALSLGGGGLFLGVSREVTPDTEVTIRFRPAKHLPVVVARGKVRYQLAGKGIGIEFADINPEDRQTILRLIHHRMDEKRRFPRAPFAAQVEHEGATLIGFSKDISAGGMFIETSEPLSVGSNLALRFHLDDTGPIITATAVVLYAVTKLGIGVRFNDLTPADRDRINAYVTREESRR